MKLGFSYIIAFAVILFAFSFLYFPIEFIDAGIGQGIFFFPTNLAATLASLYWENGIRYDCSNVYFLGYQSSFSQVVPIIIDGASQNLSMRIDDGFVAYADTSDRITSIYQAYIDKAATMNSNIVETCGVDAFAAANS